MERKDIKKQQTVMFLIFQGLSDRTIKIFNSFALEVIENKRPEHNALFFTSVVLRVLNHFVYYKNVVMETTTVFLNSCSTHDVNDYFVK